MIASLQRLVTALLDAVLPPHEDVRNARALSIEGLSKLLAPRPVGLSAQAGTGWIVALFPYLDPRIRALILAVKYYGETEALAPVGAILGGYLLEMIGEKELLAGWERPLLVPVPPAPQRLRKRGYGQAERIVRAALPTIGSAAEFCPRALAREDRESQVKVGRPKRAKNIRGAFRAPDVSLVKGRCVILVDDVAESGSTLSDARRALFEAGAREVEAVALAH